MTNVLNRMVLVLNRNWQLINERTVEEALSQMAAGAATGLDINGPNHIRPVPWEEWITLPVLREDEVIHTQHLQVRQPTVIVSVNYAKIPKRRPKFNLKNIAMRDGHTCQYTGRRLQRHEMSLDHVLPLSRGGEDAPENVVLSDKEVNNRKGNKTPEEAGLPRPKIRRLGIFLPVATHPDHEIFLNPLKGR